MADVSYEVMVYTPVMAGTMRRDTWYVESAHQTYGEARRQFRSFVEQHPDQRLVVALIQSTYDEATRRFRDRVIDARDAILPSFARTSHRLTPEVRNTLRQYFGSPQRDEGSAPTHRWRTGPGTRRSGPLSRSMVRAAAAVLAAVLAAVVAIGFLPLP